MSEAYENALLLARDGYLVFPSSRIFGPGAEAIATRDFEMIDRMNAIDPKAVWMVRCGPEFGFLVLDTPRARDGEFLLNDFGALPRTLCVSRASGGMARWFQCDADTDVALGVKLNGTQGQFRKSAVIPGSLHPISGEVYEIAGGGAFDLRRMARLPDAWLDAVPKNTPGVTANIIRRHEYTRANHGWDE